MGGLPDASGSDAYSAGCESLPEVSTGQNVISVPLSDARPTFRQIVLISNTFRPISLILHRVQQARTVRNQHPYSLLKHGSRKGNLGWSLTQKGFLHLVYYERAVLRKHNSFEMNDSVDKWGSRTPCINEQVIPKRKRIGATKSKTGCFTCKMRRIKCDETKPACIHCAGTNRVCDFLDTTPKVTQPKPTMTSRSKKPPAIISGRQLQLLPKPFTPGKPATSREIDHFEYFAVMCTCSLSGYFENPLWNKTILQISYSEPAIRNAVIALSSILRYHYTRAHSSIHSHEPALNYQNALQALNRRLDGSAVSWELALMGSLLFTSFEALGGRDTGALQHLDAGLAVLNEYAITHPNLSDNFKELSAAFSRFDTQASMFAVFYETKISTTPVVPPRFQTINHAREVLNSIVASMYRLFKPIPGGERYRTLPYKPLPPPIHTQVDHVQTLLKQWSSTFDSLIHNITPKTSSNIISIKVLQIQHLTITIHISTLFYREQLAFDAFTSDFAHVIDLAASVVETTPVNNNGSPVISFDVGIIQPLYFTACRCRHMILRRKAISLLMRSGIEGIYNGAAMAAAASWAVKYEEDGKDVFVREDRRLREVGIAINRFAKSMRLVGLVRDSERLVKYVAGTVGWGDDAGEMGFDIDGDDGLPFWVEKWREFIEHEAEFL